MTPLARRLIARIRADGPMTLADYMAACLTDPDHGYYVTRDPLGRAGDFTTAPEISQMFGECLGLALAQAWLDQGRPDRIALAELGPGRGTLMADALRAMAAVPGLRDAVEVHLVEVSPALRARQAAALPDAGPRWHDTAETLPDLPLYLVANEFLDALPVRQFVRRGDGWAERQVGTDGDRLVSRLSPPARLALLEHRIADTAEDDVVEVMPALPAAIRPVAARIAARGGAAIVIDYGDLRSRGDTFQAVASHAPVDPFAAPGAADLTAHVAFEDVARSAVAAGASAAGPVPQGVLLERLGITPRAEALARRLDGAALASHVAAHRRLTHPDEMGTLFKALAIHPPGLAPPPGFAA